MRSFHRIVTGHTASGRPAIVEDADYPDMQAIAGAQVANLRWHNGVPREDTAYADPFASDVPPPRAGVLLDAEPLAGHPASHHD
ncbi:hypothetical protein [Streptomyces hygroscopicus]|uniref:hypothetical protein n=1 Tax=Streptomyces hygroscopicus TaxID=1912 RepID=UPI001FCBB750|nr:hypothetical protein [Streptomyces hygroscopicus]BDH12699.1 hypothetical protein HOK021_38780 [Streptomyces hygroscopicus]